MANAWGKEIVVAEVNWPTSCKSPAYSFPSDLKSIPFSADGQTTFMKKVAEVVAGVKNGNGIFYWEPAWMNNAGLGSSCESNTMFSFLILRTVPFPETLPDMSDESKDDYHRPWQLDMPLISTQTNTLNTYMVRPGGQPASLTAANVPGTTDFVLGVDTCGFTTASTGESTPPYLLMNIEHHEKVKISNLGRLKSLAISDMSVPM
ncbi:hypothetical protein Daesc_004193 [Daldinia eschscholtzii]|uniref:Arabinogalactan endo-beta-1,4-galactanase n=1 Tax=Daldinia eschscholtzii TaxID=292717 RepID=A0AAX6MPA2_9PEZI